LLRRGVHPIVPQHPLPCPLRQPKPLRYPRRENARSPTRAFTPRPAKPATRPAQGAPIPSRPRAPVASRHLCAPPQRPCSQGGRAWSASSAGGAAPLSRPRSPPSYPRPHRSLPPPPLRLKVKPRRPEPRENAPVIDISGFYPGRRRGRLGRGGGGRGWSVVWRKRRRGCGRGMGLLPRMRRVHPWVGLLRQHPPRCVHEPDACPE